MIIYLIITFLILNNKKRWILFCYLNDLHPEEDPKDNPDLENKVKDIQLRMFHPTSQESHPQEGNMMVGNMSQNMTETHVNQNYMHSKSREEQGGMVVERHDQMEIENFQEMEQCSSSPSSSENNLLSEGLQLPPEVSNGFTRVLLMLNGYKVTYKNCCYNNNYKKKRLYYNVLIFNI